MAEETAYRSQPVQPDPDQSERDKNNWFYINNLHEQMRSQLQPQHLAWKLNLAFLVGFQWTDVDITRKTLEVLPPKPGDVRLVNNKILPVYNTKLAKLLQILPNFMVRPASDQPEDMEAASMGTTLLRHLNDNILDTRSKIRKALSWALSTGSGFLNLTYNPQLGPKATAWRDNGVPRSDELMKRIYGDFEYENGQVMGAAWDEPQPAEALGWERREIARGEQELEVISPFSVYPDPMAEDLDSARWIIIVRAVAKSDLLEMYGSQARYVQPESSGLYGSSVEKEMMDLFLNSRNILSEQSQRQEHDKSDYVLVKQMQRRPDLSKGEKKGRIITIAGGRVLSDIENPYKHNDFTLFMFREINMPGQFWGRALIEQMIPIQKCINKRISQIVENGDKFAKYDWVVHRKANMPRPSNRPGVHKWSGPVEPKVITPTSLPAHIWNELQYHDEGIMNVSGIREVTIQGRPPGGVESGRAIGYLQEQDEMRMSPTTEEMNVQILKMAKYQLMNAQQFYNTQRVLRVFSEDRVSKTVSFRGADLKNNFDVIIEQRSPFPRSQYAKQEMILAFFQSGIMGNPQDPRVQRHARRLLELGEESIGFNVDQLSEEEAMSENTLLEKGQPVPTISHQDHAIHQEVHRSLILSGKFKTLPEEVQQMIFAHVDEHGKWLERFFTPSPEEQQQAQMEEQGQRQQAMEDMIMQKEIEKQYEPKPTGKPGVKEKVKK